MNNGFRTGVATMAEARQRMRSDQYQMYVERAANARSASELAALRTEIIAAYPDDSTAQLLSEVLYDQQQCFDWQDGSRAQQAAVWHDDPTLHPPRRAPRNGAGEGLTMTPQTERRA
jgi:hypothetical protein